MQFCSLTSVVSRERSESAPRMGWAFYNEEGEMNLRQTGRTTRMLAEAVKNEAAGRAVYVVAANEHHAEHLRGMLPKGTTIKVETAHQLGNLEFKTLRLRGAHQNCVVLADHFAIEQEIGRVLLNELHAYDAQHGGNRWRLAIRFTAWFLGLMGGGEKRVGRDSQEGNDLRT